jgi:hypothetical protein
VLEEIARQTWRGEELIEAHFFYDQGMLMKVVATPA